MPQEGLNGRRGYQPRGKVLGGSSSINAMVYIRGAKEDYEHWAALGNEGWSYEEVLLFFKKAQNRVKGANEYHAQGGPLTVSPPRSPNPLNDMFIKAGMDCQLPYNEDFKMLEDLKISTKLRLGYGLVIFFLVILSTIVFYLMSHLGGSLEKITKVYSPKVVRSNNIIDRVNENTIYLLSATLKESREEVLLLSDTWAKSLGPI